MSQRVKAAFVLGGAILLAGLLVIGGVWFAVERASNRIENAVQASVDQLDRRLQRLSTDIREPIEAMFDTPVEVQAAVAIPQGVGVTANETLSVAVAAAEVFPVIVAADQTLPVAVAEDVTVSLNDTVDVAIEEAVGVQFDGAIDVSLDDAIDINIEGPVGVRILGPINIGQPLEIEGPAQGEGEDVPVDADIF